MYILLALLPLIAILMMLLIFKKPADISGIVGWLVVAIVAFLFFDTTFDVLVRSTAAGLIKSFSVSMIVATSLLQMAFMEKTGALKRIIIFLKTIARENKAVQIILINIGFGTLMVAVGATPVSILPPILLSIGYTTTVAIALPAIGYDSLCTYALLGAPIVVFVDMANAFTGGTSITLSQVGSTFSPILPVVSTSIGFCMLWIVGRWEGLKKGWLPCVIAGVVIGIVSHFTNKVDNLVVLTGVLCGLAVIITMVIYLAATGKKVLDKSILTPEELAYEKTYPLWKAFIPWVLLIALILILNLNKDVFNTLYYQWKFPINGLAANGKGIDTRFLWNAYTWIFVSTLLSIPFLKPTAKQLKDTVSTWLKRAPRPVFAAAIFFAIGEVMNMSGFNVLSVADKSIPKYIDHNMIKVLADASASVFHGAYGFVVSFIGLFGGFLTGSEASSIAMFANYTMATAESINVNMIIITAGLAFGAGLASVISPAKLQNAAASIDKLGEENKVIPMAFIFSLILTTITAAFIALLVAFAH